MLTGLPVFKGESVPHILADVLKTEPDWTRLPKNLHPRVRHLLERCLTKKPRSRLHSIADARIEIEAALSDPRGATPETSVAAEQKSSTVLRVAATAVVAAGIAGAAVWLLRPVPAPEPKPVVRFSIPLPEEPSFPANSLSTIAVSPDGQRIAYVAGGEIHVRNIGEREARPVQGTAEGGNGPVLPVFSPDGQALAYVHISAFAGPYVLKRVPIGGGSPVPLFEAVDATFLPHGLSWPAPDMMLFANVNGIVSIPANGGAPEVLIERGQDERLFSPQLLPGGDAVLFTRVAGTPGASSGGFDAAQIIVQSIGGNDRIVLKDGGSAGRYLPSGHLIYAQGTALFAIPFDPQTRTVRGGPVSMVEDLRRSAIGLSDTAYFAVSETGTLVMVPENPNAGARVDRRLTWVGRDGREEPLSVRGDDYAMARISPDGSRVALVLGNPLGERKADIWILDQGTEILRQLTSDPAGDDGPVWSADGSRIFFRSGRGDSPGVYAIDVDTSEATRFASPPEFATALPWALSPDGRTLALLNVTSDFNIATLSLADGEYAHLLNDPGVHEGPPSFSPNGAWFAYEEALEGGPQEISIRPFPVVSRTRIPVGPGRDLVFSRDGSELFFFDGEGLSAAPITYEPTLRVGAPTRLFETTGYFLQGPGRAWDVDLNGQRFLMIRDTSPAADGAAPRIDVVLNWFEELKSRVPVD
jgi:serine/threonine-protein kinase